ncbi:MAG: hypothetical protein KAV87_31420 [Desulfobacteraceae bacterium]|nr:hypothetical protein [Desulfobacteraceae bacterium]
MMWGIEEKRRGRGLSVDRGLSHAAIAETLNKEFHGGEPVRSAKAVRSRRFNPLPRAPVPVAMIDRIRDLVKEGLSAAEIGRQLGVTRNTIIGRCSRASIPLNDSRQRRPGRLRTASDAPAPLSLHTPTQASHCQYIHNDDMKTPDFCKKPKTHDSYCEEHHRICCPGEQARQKLGWR